MKKTQNTLPQRPSKQARRQEEWNRQIPALQAWDAVKDKPISYKEKQRLAEIGRKRRKLVTRFGAEHGQYAAEQPAKSYQRSSKFDPLTVVEK